MEGAREYLRKKWREKGREEVKQRAALPAREVADSDFMTPLMTTPLDRACTREGHIAPGRMARLQSR